MRDAGDEEAGRYPSAALKNRRRQPREGSVGAQKPGRTRCKVIQAPSPSRRKEGRSKGSVEGFFNGRRLPAMALSWRRRADGSACNPGKRRDVRAAAAGGYRGGTTAVTGPLGAENACSITPFASW